MDDFLRDIHVEIFKHWILSQQSSLYDMRYDEEENIIFIETPYCDGTITFYDQCIIELDVVNALNNEPLFYLHFQMQTLSHALELYRQMTQVIENFVERPVFKVLFSCSGGMTTSYFAAACNEGAKLLGENYSFEAVAYTEIEEKSDQFDLIMVAPQISYMIPDIEALTHKKVLSIPSPIFAKYDVGGMFTFLNEQSYKQDTYKVEPLVIKRVRKHKHKILSIVVIQTGETIRLPYRVYDKNNHILIDGEVVKKNFNVSDIEDIIRFILTKYNIRYLGLSVPGIVKKGIFTLPRYGFIHTNIVEHLEKLFPIRVTLVNDVNSAAVGFYASQDTYNSLSFYFQPGKGMYGGIGTVFQGQLIKGRSALAGEQQFLPFVWLNDYEELSKTHEGILSIITYTIVNIIAMIDPEVIILKVPGLLKEEEIRQSVYQYLTPSYVPEFILLDDFKEYDLLGAMILALQ